jgi:hypothetical protein
MEFIFGAVAVVFCIAMVFQGYLKSILIGGFIGSFFGLAGFGGAVSGMLPGAVLGGVIAVALKRGSTFDGGTRSKRR